MGKIHVVLFEPEIPQNTGNIMRTCAGTGSILHLIRPLGFSLSDKVLKRSAVNYTDHTEFYVYDDWDDFLSKNKGNMYFFTRYAIKTPHHLDLKDPQMDYYFVIGKESTGIDKAILKANLDYCIRLPMNEHIRSLNVSNVAAIAIYEALRQQNYRDLLDHEPDSMKGKDFLTKKD